MKHTARIVRSTRGPFTTRSAGRCRAAEHSMDNIRVQTEKNTRRRPFVCDTEKTAARARRGPRPAWAKGAIVLLNPADEQRCRPSLEAPAAQSTQRRVGTTAGKHMLKTNKKT